MKRKHLWIMLACCLLPVGALIAATVFGVPLGTLGTFALLLLCPLGHLLMMRGSGHKSSQCCQTLNSSEHVRMRG